MLDASITELYQCTQCSYGSEWAFDIDHHVQRKHHNVYAAELYHAICEPEQFPCSWCDVKSRFKLRLYEHFKLKHQEEDNDAWCGRFDWYKCNQCKFKAYSSLQVVKHLDRCGTVMLRKLLAKSKICASTETEHIEKLATFLLSLPQLELLKSKDENILRARAAVAYYQRCFRELYGILQSHTFSKKWHKELQTLWFKGHYDEAQILRNKRLGEREGPVEKYRIRKKHPLPKTIWDGEETLYHYNKQSRKMLMECYQAHQFLSAKEKNNLAKKTGLSAVQVSNWFKNRRQRDRDQQRKGLGPTIISTEVPAHLPTFDPRMHDVLMKNFQTALETTIINCFDESCKTKRK